MSLPQTMRAAVLVRPHEVRLEERTVPKPAPDEVLVRVTAVGVCGSDVHFYREGRLGDWVLDEPLILGHESGGEIVAVGAAVAPERLGERVSIEPQHPSPSSAETLRGDYNLDPHMKFYAVPGTDGAFCEYVTIQSHFAHHVPDSVSDGAAALLEPLSVAIAAGRKAELRPGSRVLITGAGPVGLAIAQVARASGATDVLITDISAERRAAALRFGATTALDPVADATAVAASHVDAFIDASGAGAAVRAGLEALRPAGRAVLVGMGLAELPFPVTHIQNNELIVTGVFRYANTWPAAVAMAASGHVDLDAMITGTFPLSETEAALESTTTPGTIKSVVAPQR
nr:NAD(P)-dependent alcohol dehydrogenase [Microbacterium protaetiae]